MFHNGHYPSYRPTRHNLEALTRERERSEAARRARRAQYLPPEDVDDEEEDQYGWPSQTDRMNFEARRRQEASERLETERRRETEAFRRRMGQENQRAVEKEKIQTYQRPPNQASQKRSVPINISGSPPRKSNNATPPRTPTPPVVKYTQAHEDAAERIQKWYRRYRAVMTINDVSAQFEQTKNELVFPDSLDFVDPDKPGDVITISVVLALEAADGDVAVEVGDNHPVPPPTTTPSSVPPSPSTPEPHDYEVVTAPSSSEDTCPPSQHDSSNESSARRLAYTKRNYPVHAYMEKLNMLLMKLDGVQSYGSRKIRERRKEVARMIEKEAARIESVWKELGEGESATVMDA